MVGVAGKSKGCKTCRKRKIAVRVPSPRPGALPYSFLPMLTLEPPMFVHEVWATTTEMYTVHKVK
jgi:hypothetical protein